MPVIILLTCFGLLFIINKLILKTRMSLSQIGRVSLSIMLLFTAISHFLKTDLMIEMMPEFFAHNCPTINATAEVNHFAHPEFSRVGGFSAESILRPDPLGCSVNRPIGNVIRARLTVCQEIFQGFPPVIRAVGNHGC